MKLLFSVVNSRDAGELAHALVEAGFRVTLMSSAGGFLRRGNTTLLVATEDERVEEALRIINDTCHPPPDGGLYIPGLGTRQIGAATVMILEVERFERC
ncbi:MAG: cyclic-di-AMP receptor [Anaerolineae bacterium]|nr:cyclic-di-AMP receptor [Anaerolineae bacterium]